MSTDQEKQSRPEGVFIPTACRLLTILSVLVGCSPLLARWWWIADLVANLRVQLLLALCVATIIVAMGVGRRQAFIVLCVILLNGIAMIPAVRSDRTTEVGQTNAGLHLRVCTNNVLTWNRQHRRIIESIREANADVVAVIELSSDLGDVIQTDLASEFPHFISRVNDDGNFGIGLISKHPIRHHEIFYLCEPLVPSIEADIEINGRVLRVIATHPIPPVRKSAFEARNTHLGMLADRVRSFRAANPDVPVVLIGDLNLAPWSPHFDAFLDQSELLNASSGKGLQPTWYRWNAFPFGLVIDHGLHSQELTCTERQVLGETGSDHRPVVFDFRW